VKVGEGQVNYFVTNMSMKMKKMNNKVEKHSSAS
jgi:hypothetical protein